MSEPVGSCKPSQGFCGTSALNEMGSHFDAERSDQITAEK